MQVFISYCREDMTYLKRLRQTIESYGAAVSDTCWSDQSVLPSEAWMKSLQNALHSARVAVLLVTPGFLASPFIRQHELPTLLQRAEAKTLRLIPVPVRAVDWASQPFQKYQSPWDPKYPLVGGTKAKKDKAYVLLGKLIKEALNPVPTVNSTSHPESQGLPEWFHMPHERNPLFVGRVQELEALHAGLNAKEQLAITPKVATMGLGGIGKSQLAVEYAYRYAPHYPGGVFWLNCDQVEAVAGEVADCGVTMRLYARDNRTTQDHKTLTVQDRWRGDKRQRLLIYDNCEDEAVLKRWPVRDPHLHLLVTSRRSWPATLGLAPLALPTLARPESIALLQAHRSDLTTDDADRIAATLGDLPLALYLAGCYLENFPIDTKSYLAALERDLLAHGSLLGKGADGYQPTDHDRHVARTFATSYDHLDATQAADTLAQTLLLRASFLAPGAPFHVEHLAPDDLTPELVGEALVRLSQLGLLQREGQDFVIHRLLAHFCRTLNKAETAKQAENLVTTRIDELAEAADNTGLPARMAPHLAHLRHLAERQAQQVTELSARLSNTLAFYLDLIGAYAESEPWYRRSLACAEQVFGPDHSETAIRLNNLATSLHATHRPLEAEPLFRRALAINEAALGPDHPKVAIRLGNLANLLRDNQRMVEAEPLYQRALAIDEAALGPDHPDLAIDLNNLAELLRATHRLEEAEPLFRRALQIDEARLGLDHPNVARDLNNLGELMYDLRLAEAEPLFRRALAIDEAALGPNHPNVARDLNSLAKFLDATQRLAEAEPLFRRASDICLAALGADHPRTQACQKKRQLVQAELATE